jgi:hypothetical protein
MLDLGYTVEGAALYMRLLIAGARSPERLEVETGLRGGSLRQPMLKLISDGLVFEDREGFHTVWYCFDPAVSWLSLAAEATWSVVSSLNALDDLPATGLADVDARRDLLIQARALATRIWAGPGDSPRHRHSRAANSRILARLVLEAVNQASTRVRAISASPKISEASAFWPVMVRRLHSGLQYLRVADVNEVYEHGLRIVRRDLRDGVDLRLGSRQDLVGHRGYLADRRILVKYDVAPPGSPPESGVMLSDKHAINRFVNSFNRLRATAIPAPDVLDHLERLLPDLQDRVVPLGPDAVAWFDEIAAMGKFAVLPQTAKWSAAHRRKQLRLLVEAGAVVLNDQGLILPAWPAPDDVVQTLRKPRADTD